MNALQGHTEISLTERLLLQTELVPKTGCLVPTKVPYRPGGSCQIKVNGRLYTMRHVSFALAGGILDIGQVVGSVCSTPGCVCPSHLKAMTRSEAMLDALKRRART
jgi:hypothetical protein